VPCEKGRLGSIRLDNSKSKETNLWKWRDELAANRWQRITPAFLIGVGLGAALGVLFAPRSGEETRDQISASIKDGVDSFAAQGNELSRRAKKTIENAKEHVRDVAEAGEHSFRKAKAAVS
jgi:gas vesicle protein